MAHTELRLTIRLGNAEMRDGWHAAEALEGVAERIRGIYDMPKHIEEGGQLYGPVYDANGNTVGRWSVQARRSTEEIAEQVLDGYSERLHIIDVQGAVEEAIRQARGEEV